MSNLWQINTNTFANEKESIMRNGNVYQIANGYMGYRGTLDEFGRNEFVGITLAGLYDQAGDAWREPVNAPNGGYTTIALDGIEISALSSKIKRHRQSLNLENAVFERETDFELWGKIVRIKSARFLSADQPNLGVIKYSLTVDKAARVRILTGIDYNIWDLNGPHLIKLMAERKNGILLVRGITGEASKRVAVAEAVHFHFGKETHKNDSRKNLRMVDLEAEAGRTYTFFKFFAVYTDNDPIRSSVKESAIRKVIEAKNNGYAECLRKHNVQWAKKWSCCDVRIDGDNEAQLALRYSIFQLLLVAPLNDSAHSIPARALTGWRCRSHHGVRPILPFLRIL